MSQESIALLKDTLRAHMATMPPALKEKYKTALDEEDVDVLSEFSNLIDNAYSYVNEKGRAEEAKHADIRDRLRA